MEENIICNCLNVSEDEIVQAIHHQGAVSLQKIQDITGAMSGCGSCINDVKEILKRELNK
jgi:bacterioferritin-associated ferredoxin